jgi:hypothetical protein
MSLIQINSADVLEFLGWVTLEERRKRNKSILMYRILNIYTALNLIVHCKDLTILETDLLI